jgi:TolB-like protein/tetratricopeptide (TPR) repeat protein
LAPSGLWWQIVGSMTDVFISYKREDYARVKPLADALTADGLQVWWDMEIPGGAGWRQTIEDALRNAKCVLVVWSRRSVGPEGEFVQEEATHAKARGVYLPICIDPVQPPLGFGQIQVLPLLRWNGRRDDAGYAKLYQTVCAIAESRARPGAASNGKASAPKRGPRLRPRIAVLPFGHPAGDAEQADFAEALVDDLIAGLSKSPLFAVTPRQSSVIYEPSAQQPSSICGELGVDYVVQGAVRKMGRSLRVSVELVRGEDETSVWSARYDRPIDDLFAVLDEITLAIVGTLEPAVLEQEEARILRAPDRSLAFWELFVSGRRHFWRSTAKDVRKAEAFLVQALALEPDDAPSLAILAHCRLYDVWVGSSTDPGAAIEEAYRLALKAVSLAGSDAFAHYTLGVVLSTQDRWPEAEAAQRRALELNPYLAAALGELGRILAFAGKTAEAVAYSDRAIAASPNDPHVWLWYRSKSIANFAAGDLEAAERDAVDACARGPQRFYLHILLSACYSAAGRMEDAGRAYSDAQRLARDEAAVEGRSTARQGGESAGLRALKISHPFRDPAHLETFLAALRAARAAASDLEGAR